MSPLGLLHTATAVVALVSGTMALWRPGLRRAHRRWGYAYVAAMVVMLATSFGLYNMLGRWGPFHYLAVVSSVTLAGGMLPLWLRRPRGSYLGWHLAFIYWSLAGLYAALVAETGTRLFTSLRWGYVVGATLVVMVAAQILFRLRLKRWIALTETPS